MFFEINEPDGSVRQRDVSWGRWYKLSRSGDRCLSTYSTISGWGSVLDAESNFSFVDCRRQRGPQKLRPQKSRLSQSRHRLPTRLQGFLHRVPLLASVVRAYILAITIPLVEAERLEQSSTVPVKLPASGPTSRPIGARQFQSFDEAIFGRAHRNDGNIKPLVSGQNS